MKFSDYDDAEEKYEMGGEGGGWMRLEEGDNKIRIVSEFEDYGQHWSKVHGRSYPCLGKEECPFCQKNEEAEGDAPSPVRVKYLGWVIDREDGRVKLLKIGHSIFKQIGQLAVNDEYKFEAVPKYDLTIKRIGTGLDTKYSVIPGREDKELTEEEQEMADEVTQSSPAEIIDTMKTKLRTTMIDEWGMEMDDNDDKIKVEDIPF